MFILNFFKIVSVAIVIFISPLSLFAAGGASLMIDAVPLRYEVGDSILVKILVNTSGDSINSAESKIVFDPNKITVSSISKQESLFSLWTEEPAFDNSLGIINFGGGTPSPYNGSEGRIITANFLAKGLGPTSLNFDKSRILKSDGFGTDVFGGGQGITLEILPKSKETIKPLKPAVDKKQVSEKPAPRAVTPPQYEWFDFYQVLSGADIIVIILLLISIVILTVAVLLNFLYKRK